MSLRRWDANGSGSSDEGRIRRIAGDGHEGMIADGSGREQCPFAAERMTG